MVIFRVYVNLPEGKSHSYPIHIHQIPVNIHLIFHRVYPNVLKKQWFHCSICTTMEARIDMCDLLVQEPPLRGRAGPRLERRETDGRVLRGWHPQGGWEIFENHWRIIG